jgi:hypothetical protein
VRKRGLLKEIEIIKIIILRVVYMYVQYAHNVPTGDIDFSLLEPWSVRSQVFGT